MSIIQNQNRLFDQDTFGPLAAYRLHTDTLTFNPLVAQPFLPPQGTQAPAQSQGKWDSDFKLFDVNWLKDNLALAKKQANQQEGASESKKGISESNKDRSESRKGVNESRKAQVKVFQGLSLRKVSKEVGELTRGEKGKKKPIRKRKHEQTSFQPKISLYFKSMKESLEQSQK